MLFEFNTRDYPKVNGVLFLPVIETIFFFFPLKNRPFRQFLIPEYLINRVLFSLREARVASVGRGTICNRQRLAYLKHNKTKNFIKHVSQ